MPNIEIIQPSDADGYIREVYDQILESRGKIAEIYKIQSLNPRSIIRHLDLYITLMYSKSPLSRQQREMLGVVVSSVNKCDYCKVHHSQALLHYWKDEKRVQQLSEKYADAGLDEKELMLCELADLSTTTPYSRKISSLIKKMKKKSFTDRAILDATLIISYFNFVNRIALNLEVELEKDPGGYKY
ncbi:MAG TPA: peroxidase-related enzyme [Bacteroidales bacterium]|nr:peroxidase-related enzyme [Bacteroidales bacterium]